MFSHAFLGHSHYTAGQESQIDFNQNSTLVAKMGMTYFAPDWGFNFYGYNSTLNTTPIMTMRGNGNVGIGTTGPTSKLTVSASAGTAQTIIQNSATGYGLVIVPGADSTYDAVTINNAANSVNRHRFMGNGDAYLALGAGNVGVGTTSSAVKLQVAGPIGHITEVLGVASFFASTSPAYFKIFTKIPWMSGNGYPGQVRIRGYGYGSSDFDTVISWYEWVNTFYAPGSVTKFHSQIGKRAPTRVRIGVWNDAGTNRVALEIANDSVYWSSYTVDLYKHAGLADSYAANWTAAVGAFDASITNIVEIPQVGAAVQLNNGNVGIGTTSPSYTLDVSGTMRVTGQAYTNTGNGSFSILSDIRYKDVHGKYNRGLAEILNIDIIKFNYKKDNPLGSDSSHEYVGISAQNLQATIPEAVEVRKDKGSEYLTVNTSPVLWTLINAVKQLYNQVMERFEEQDRQIASIVESKADKAEIEALKRKVAEVDTIKAENAALKAYLCSKDPAAPICK